MREVLEWIPFRTNCHHKVIDLEYSGVGKPTSKTFFGRKIQQHYPNIYVLLETQLSRRSLDCIKQRIQLAWSIYAVESRGLSRKILLM